jgi:hypothetical protein
MLVVLKENKELLLETDLFKPHHHYRCLPVTENNITEYMVYGVVFNQEGFDKYFESSNKRLLRDFKSIGLLKDNDRPLSKTAFLEQANVHTFGKGKAKDYSFYFYVHPKECMYMFRSVYGGTKLSQLKNVYQYYLGIISNNLDSIDCGQVQFGNCGISIGYSDKLRIRY